MPLYVRLGVAFDANAHRALVTTRWIRTVAWALHGALVASWLALARALERLR